MKLPGIVYESQVSVSLVQAATSGDVASLELLLLKYYDQLLNRVRSNFSEADLRRREAEDIVQQAHERAFRSIDSFRGTSQEEFRAWLFRICDNILTDNRRRESSSKRSGHRRRLSIDSPETIALWSDISDTLSPSRVAIEREERAQLAVAMRNLTEDEFALIQMRYFEQMSPTEIARTMGMPRSSIARKCIAALDRIRRLLGISSGMT